MLCGLSRAISIGVECLSMSSETTRDRIIEALQDLPPEATFEDAIKLLVFLDEVKQLAILGREGFPEVFVRMSLA